MNCPCLSGQSFDRCCGRFISQAELPENAEQLMRSRYSAFALGNSDYLRQTWHASQRPPAIDPDPELRWLGLQVLAVADGAETSTVEFEARFLRHGRVDAIHERSRFVREQGRWYYSSGEMLEPTFQAWKPGRNEACPCGSGLKFKRCCANG